MSSKAQLRFLGAAKTVTGSKYLLTARGKNILIDCGLFQGLKNLRLQNWEPFPIDPKTIDAVILTHAHIDHSGYIPRLIKEGFRGRIYCTAGTLALCRILLPDTGYLQEEEAEYFNRKKISKHNPALPLFTREEAEASIRRFVPRGFHEDFEAVEGIHVRFLYAGHIMGAAMAVVTVDGIKIGFSGDVGRPNDPVLNPPDAMPAVDYLLVESTYGDRLHPNTDPMGDIESIVNQTAARKGVVVVPAFAVGRAQTLIYYLTQLRQQGRIPEIPIYLNSPMATSVTDLLFQFRSLHKLSEAECEKMRQGIRIVKSAEESKMLNLRHGPMVIISASGMATGGRILHHLRQFAPDPNNTILLAGFQAAGTRGQALESGAREIKIFGEFVPVHATVTSVENLSAHADYREITAWLTKSNISPKKTFVVHGEATSAAALAAHLSKELNWSCEVPDLDAKYDLESHD